jgi:hypothetical protein
MQYPSHLLPKSNHKCIESSLKNQLLIRHVSVKNQASIWDENTNTVNVRNVCSPRENIYDLSTSLYGVFKKENCYIELTDIGKAKFSHYCNCDEDVKTAPRYLDEFFYKEDKDWFFLKIKNLSTLKAEYFNPQNGQKFVAESKVEHAPMKWDFWHFSLKWEITYPKEANFSSNMKKKLASEARASIVHFCKKQADENPEITEEIYLK